MTAKNQIAVESFYKLLTPVDDGIRLESPVLKNIDKNGRSRVWQILMELVNDDGEIIPILEEYIMNRTEPDVSYVAQYYAISGLEIGEKTEQEPTIVNTGKNLGKVNETTIITQAILECKSQYESKIKAGYMGDADELSPDARPFPMALENYNEKKNPPMLMFPCYVQPKRDGIMMISQPDRDLLMTRGREDVVAFPAIKSEMKRFSGEPDVYYVGEFHSDKYKLQDLSGLARKKKETPDITDCYFYIFDIFVISNPGMMYEQRKTFLEKKFAIMDTMKTVRLMETMMVRDRTELQSKHDEYVAAGYEGLVARNKTAKYIFSFNKEIRSSEAVKIKLRFDAEWPVVGFTSGTSGRDLGAIIWICSENSGAPVDSREKFTVVPNMTVVARKKIFAYFEADPDEFYGNIYENLLTIDYSTLSTKKLPLQPKALRFKDPEVEEYINSLE